MMISKISNFIRFRRTFRNYIKVSIGVLKDRYPVLGQTRNGEIYRFDRHSQLCLFSYLKNSEIGEVRIEEDIVTLSYHSNKLVFYGGWNDGDLFGVFLEDAYKQLNVNGRCVIDIGGNIGDSAIYFVLNGASRVISVEPFPKTYEKALFNINVNKLNKRVEIRNAAVSVDNKGVYLDANETSTGLLSATDFNMGQLLVRSLTLDDIVRMANSEDIVLKMDCEGCEYSLMSTNSKVLESVQEILLEYHRGFVSIVKFLEGLDFEVRRNGNSTIGMIYAKKKR